jgi:hypothetical protein
MFCLPRPELRGGLARFLQIAAQLEVTFQVLIHRAATTNLLGNSNLSFYTSFYKRRAKTVTRQMKYTDLLGSALVPFFNKIGMLF